MIVRRNKRCWYTCEICSFTCPLQSRDFYFLGETGSESNEILHRFHVKFLIRESVVQMLFVFIEIGNIMYVKSTKERMDYKRWVGYYFFMRQVT